MHGFACAVCQRGQSDGSHFFQRRLRCWSNRKVFWQPVRGQFYGCKNGWKVKAYTACSRHPLLFFLLWLGTMKQNDKKKTRHLCWIFMNLLMSVKSWKSNTVKSFFGYFSLWTEHFWWFCLSVFWLFEFLACLLLLAIADVFVQLVVFYFFFGVVTVV